MKHKPNKSGQSLVELLVAIGLTAVLLPALITAVVAASEGRAQGQQRTEANVLLKEAEEAIRTVRESNWQQLNTNGTFHPVITGSNWTLTSGSENINGYTRKIEIQDTQRDESGNIAATGTIDPSTKKIITTVSWNTPISSQVDSTAYFSRYQANANIGETTQAQFNLGTKTNTQVLNNAGGEVELIQSSTTSDYGNKFSVTATSSIGNMTSINHKTSLRFTAQETKTISALRVYLQAENGTSPSYRFGIQADSGGNPSGTFVASGTRTSTATGWTTPAITISPAVTLTAGSVYHLVIEPVGTPSGSANIGLRRTSPQNQLYSKTNVADAQANTLFKTTAAGAWTIQNFQPIYELDYSDGTFEGNPYETNSEISIFGNNWVGEKFTVAGTNKTANSVSFCIRKVGTPGGSLTLELRDNANTTIYSSVLSAIAATPTAYTCPGSWQIHTFPSAITLTSSTTYRLFLRTTGGNNGNSYRVMRLDTTSAANFNSISYDGTNAVYTNTTTAAPPWTDTNQSDLAGFFFTVTTPPAYSATGTFESQTKDSGSIVAFNNLKWTATTPAGTSIQFQTAISNLTTGPWAPANYFGPDGTSASFFSANSFIPISKINGRYIRYKAFFTSTGPNTPSLGDVNVNYSP
jgi:hypothetical protein